MRRLIIEQAHATGGHMHGFDLHDPISPPMAPVAPTAPRTTVRWIVGGIAAAVALFGVSVILGDDGFYQVEISHRGKISEDEKNTKVGTLYFVGSIG